jgi:hypothetical protein
MITRFPPSRRRWAIWAAILSLGMAMASANSAWAAGGGHVVDDSEVETPGSCHVETSVARLQANAALAVISPACTPELLPNLELGFSAAYNPAPATQISRLVQQSNGNCGLRHRD